MTSSPSACCRCSPGLPYITSSALAVDVSYPEQWQIRQRAQHGTDFRHMPFLLPFRDMLLLAFGQGSNPSGRLDGHMRWGFCLRASVTLKKWQHMKRNMRSWKLAGNTRSF